MNLKFDIQRFRDEEDVLYRGRRRWSGNHGQIWLNNSKVFEHKSFECKVVFNREDVIIGNSVDSKVVSMSGEGEIVIVNVFNRVSMNILKSKKPDTTRALQSLPSTKTRICSTQEKSALSWQTSGLTN